MGVAGTELKWFARYLEGRSQFVSLGEIISKMLTINIGVPQGSILGLLLFLVYINNLPNCTNLKTFLFADDTNLLAAGENIIELFEKVREEFGKVSQYFFRNKLSLHPSKTKLIVFTNSQTAKNYRGSVTINFNNNNKNNPDKIHQISCMYGNESGEPIRFLGMYFDPSLNFKYHINYLSKKLSSAIYFIRTAKNLLTPKALKSVYYSLFHSHLIYGIQSWSTASQDSINKIYKLQKKAIRLINNAAYNAHTEPLFKASKILPLPSLIEFFLLQLMQQYVQGFLPKQFNNIWITNQARINLANNGQHRYLLRNSNNLYIPFCRLTSVRKHPFFTIPKLWQDFNCPEIKIIRNKIEFNF